MASLHKKEGVRGHTQNKKQFFLTEITKADDQLSETFYFIKISYDRVMNLFSILSEVFCQKSDTLTFLEMKYAKVVHMSCKFHLHRTYI